MRRVLNWPSLEPGLGGSLFGRLFVEIEINVAEITSSTRKVSGKGLLQALAP